MNHRISRLAVALAMAGALSACGGSSEPSAPAQPDTQLSGYVRDATGAPVAGVRVVLENRVTDDVFGAITEADGRYQVMATAGVYDVLYDDLDRADWVSHQRTAVDLPADRSDDVVLQRADTLSPNQLNGQLTDGWGVPLGGRHLLVIPAIARSPAALGDVPMPSAVAVQTGADGSFSTPLGQSGQDIDFDVFLIAAGAPELDVAPLALDYPFADEQARADYLQVLLAFFDGHVEEQLDVEKPDGAMQLNMVAGHSVLNRRPPSNKPSGPIHPLPMGDPLAKVQAQPVASWGDAATRVSQAMQRGLMSLIPSAEAAQLAKRFDVRWDYNPKTQVIREMVLENGRIDVDRDRKRWSLITLLGHESSLNDRQVQLLDSMSIALHNDVSWLDWLRGNNQIILRTRAVGVFHFTDRTGDTYLLRVIVPDNFSRTVNFRSKQPDIVKIRWVDRYS